MRVVGGKARGHKLYAPDGLSTRPTTDRVKESIFNMIDNYVYNSNFLDLYSGTGGIGIEALSRGAKKCTFVDTHTKDIIIKNLDHVKKALGDYEVHLCEESVNNAINNFYNNNEKFDIIFMDPPYKKELNVKTVKQIREQNILYQNGILIVEQSIDDDINKFEHFEIIKEKHYGKTIVLILKLED